MRSRTIVALAATATLLAGTPVASATTPGENGRLVFSADTGAGLQLYTVRPNGRGLRQITHVAGEAVNADWSPDGRTIVFAVAGPDGARIALTNSRGDNQRYLTPTGLQDQPAFTPDGRQIVFEKVTHDTDESIWIMRRDGRDQRRLTRNPFPGQGWDTDPNVSPDGKVVTFVRIKQPEALQALFSVHIDGSHLRQLTPYSLDVGIKHDWSPDGSRIAIITHADFPQPGQSANVATVRPNGTGLRRLTHYRGGETNALTGSYSPDGRWIAFRLEDHGRFALYKIHPDGSSAQRILRLPVAPRYIDWGPQWAG